MPGKTIDELSRIMAQLRMQQPVPTYAGSNTPMPPEAQYPSGGPDLAAMQAAGEYKPLPFEGPDVMPMGGPVPRVEQFADQLRGLGIPAGVPNPMQLEVANTSLEPMATYDRTNPQSDKALEAMMADPEMLAALSTPPPPPPSQGDIFAPGEKMYDAGGGARTNVPGAVRFVGEENYGPPSAKRMGRSAADKVLKPLGKFGM